MSRPKGVKDSKPRKMSENSLAQLPKKQPGMESRVFRFYGESSVLSWLGRMSSPERGQMAATAQQSGDAE